MWQIGALNGYTAIIAVIAAMGMVCVFGLLVSGLLDKASPFNVRNLADDSAIYTSGLSREAQIDERNEKALNEWRFRWYLRSRYADAWPIAQRRRFDFDMSKARLAARQWIEAGKQYRRAAQFERTGNLIVFPTKQAG